MESPLYFDTLITRNTYHLKCDFHPYNQSNVFTFLFFKIHFHISQNSNLQQLDLRFFSNSSFSFPSPPDTESLVALPDPDGVSEPPSEDKVAKSHASPGAKKKTESACTKESPNWGGGRRGEADWWWADEENQSEESGKRGCHAAAKWDWVGLKIRGDNPIVWWGNEPGPPVDGSSFGLQLGLEHMRHCSLDGSKRLNSLAFHFCSHIYVVYAGDINATRETKKGDQCLWKQMLPKK